MLKSELNILSRDNHYTKSFNFSIRGYGVISLTDSILIIGGRYTDMDGNYIDISNIVKYKVTATVEQWSQIGNLQKPRTFHRALINGNRIYVIGGRAR